MKNGENYAKKVSVLYPRHIFGLFWLCGLGTSPWNSEKYRPAVLCTLSLETQCICLTLKKKKNLGKAGFFLFTLSFEVYGFCVYNLQLPKSFFAFSFDKGCVWFSSSSLSFTMQFIINWCLWQFKSSFTTLLWAI